MTSPNESILAKICTDKLEHIKLQKAKFSQQYIESLVKETNLLSPCKGFYGALASKALLSQNALIAEVKKASPSKGLIRADFDPEKIAKAYQRGGATCLSVLTDVPYFQGCDEYLQIVRFASNLPILRKDFMLDVYQVFEARGLGADCILLIMAALSDEQAAELENVAINLGMDVLVEVHDEFELHRALKLKSKLIGINNRNLKTLVVDIHTTIRLAAMVPGGYTIICESGITSHEEVVKMNQSGVYGFLVGESLMAQEDIEAATRRLING